MIHFSKRIASYVYLRNGIYYFQIRLKKNDSRHRQFKSGLIRKSLKTGNYGQAVHDARLLWLEYMTDKKTIIDTQNEIDRSAQYHADLYSRGKELYEIYSKIDPDDANVIDEFFAFEFGTGSYKDKFDKEAFSYYSDHINKRSGDAVEGVKIPSGVTVVNKQVISLRVMIDKFIDDNQKSAEPWRKSKLSKYQRNLGFFCEQMGDCNIEDMTSANIRDQYVNTLHLLPKNARRNKILQDKEGNMLSTKDIINLTKKHKLETQSVRTIKKKAGNVKAFLTYLSDDEYIDDKVLNALNALNKLKTVKKKRVGFNDEHLKLMFNRKEFYQGLWFKKYIFRHWGLLLALYTGARINEICQLHTSDIIKCSETGIHYINFTDKGGEKSLKTVNSSREVPVHKVLINLGFLNYVEQQRVKKEKRLFSEVTLTDKDVWCRKLKDWFNHSYMEQVGIEKFVSDNNTTRSFHCFRNTVVNFGKQNGLDRAIMEEVVGHERAFNKNTHDDYSELYNLKNRKREIDKLNFVIDVDKIKKWK